MRYNPATDRAITIDEIAAQCRAAIMKADAQPEPDLYDEICEFEDFEFEWDEDDLLVPAAC